MPNDPLAGPLVTVCHGCCCGTARKHPGVDHTGLLAELVDGVGSRGRVRTSDCIDACARSNVVVVAPAPAGRRAGARPVWLAGVLDPDAVEGIVDWVRRGGPGLAAPGAAVGERVFAAGSA